MTPEQRRHIVYELMTRDYLLLRAEDSRALQRAHGWTPEQIADMRWRSAPSFTQKIFIEDDLKTALAYWQVPGFYCDAGGWRLNLRPLHGLLLPWMDGERIAALLHFANPRDRRPRLVTSGGLPGGSEACRPRI